MRAATILHLVVAFAATNLGCVGSRLPTGSIDTSILQTVVRDRHFQEWIGSDTEVLLLNVTAPPSEVEGKAFFFHEIFTRQTSISAELLESLRERNRKTVPLPSLGSTMEQVSSTELARRWPAAIQNHQRRYVWLSLPGFSSSGNAAAVAVTAHSQGPCCGAGYIALLERDGRVWRVVRRDGDWIE